MRRWGFLSLALIALLTAAAPAQAQFPGSNGPILFVGPPDAQNHIMYTVNPDGSGLQPTGETAIFDNTFPYHNTERVQRKPRWAPAGGDFAYAEDAHEADIYWQGLKLHSGAALREYCGVIESPNWSPDGRYVIYPSNLLIDGSGDCFDPDTEWPYESVIQLYDVVAQTPVPGHLGQGHNPDWSPDGVLIAFDFLGGIWTMSATGANRTRITDGTDPTWSPDGSKLAFTASDGSDTEIYVVNRDGSGSVQLTDNTTGDGTPEWSPDGTKIVYGGSNSRLHVMNPDGSGDAELPTGLAASGSPSWQSIPINAYPRPKAASPMDVSLVPAYTTCVAPNREHAAPLAHDSCAPPQQMSGQLTVGTPDANSRAANSVASVRMKVINDDGGTPADDADVQLLVNVTDVRRGSDLSDYTGELRLSAIVRATDKLNQPSPTPSGLGAATVGDVGFGPPVPCNATSDPAIGSTCAVATTVDALIPGLAIGGARSVWQFSQLRVDDGGADDDGDTTGDNAPFMTQGVFVP